MPKGEEVVSTKVPLFILLAVVSLAMIGCGRTQAAPPPMAPEVRVAPVIQQDVRVKRMGGHLGRLRERADPTPGLRLHSEARLQRGFARPQRPVTVPFP
jgi:hypothetical protein